MHYILFLSTALFFSMCDVALAADEEPEIFEVIMGLGILLFILWLFKVLIFGFSSKKSSSETKNAKKTHKKKSKKSHAGDDDDDYDDDDDNDSDDSGDNDSGSDD